MGAFTTIPSIMRASGRKRQVGTGRCKIDTSSFGSFSVGGRNLPGDGPPMSSGRSIIGACPGSPNRATRYIPSCWPYPEIRIPICSNNRWSASSSRRSPTRSQSGIGRPSSHRAHHAATPEGGLDFPNVRHRSGEWVRREDCGESSRLFRETVSHCLRKLRARTHTVSTDASTTAQRPTGKAVGASLHLAPAEGSAEWG